MPTPYSGDPSAAQAPGPAPGPGGVPTTFGGITTASTTTPQMIVGPVRYCQITPR
jgi:hypothetical protein